MERLTGDEHFTYEGSPINRLLNDFWAWQASDLLTNSIRGALAEYIVATALDIDGTYRMNDWHEYDLEYYGKKIEVKSSAYLQSWERDKLSRISFNIYESRPFTASVWDSDDIRRHADIYVFCLFGCKDRAAANPMLLEQWSFFVLPTRIINEKLGTQRTVSLSTLEQLPAVKCTYDKLRNVIDEIVQEAGE